LFSDVPHLAEIQEPHEAQINRSLINDDRLLSDLLNPTSDAVAVQRTHLLQRLEDHEIERALQDGRPRFHHVYFPVGWLEEYRVAHVGCQDETTAAASRPRLGPRGTSSDPRTVLKVD
jgi:hypothetical protein